MIPNCLPTLRTGYSRLTRVTTSGKPRLRELGRTQDATNQRNLSDENHEMNRTNTYVGIEPLLESEAKDRLSTTPVQIQRKAQERGLGRLRYQALERRTVPPRDVHEQECRNSLGRYRDRGKISSFEADKEQLSFYTCRVVGYIVRWSLPNSLRANWRKGEDLLLESRTGICRPRSAVFPVD